VKFRLVDLPRIWRKIRIKDKSEKNLIYQMIKGLKAIGLKKNIIALFRQLKSMVRIGK
jgi:hypothetical protein